MSVKLTYFRKMDYVSTAEKEASEVLRTLLSVDRRALDSKENIIVSIENGSQDLSGSDQAQWHTPVLGQHSVFNITDGEGIEQGEFTQRDQQQVCSSSPFRNNGRRSVPNYFIFIYFFRLYGKDIRFK